jgi:hypothetical protein
LILGFNELAVPQVLFAIWLLYKYEDAPVLGHWKDGPLLVCDKKFLGESVRKIFEK